MKIISLIVFLFFISLPADSQSSTSKGTYPLHQLRKTKSAFPHYVNFDVLKAMVPLNRDNNINPTGFGMQLLWPYAFFKRKWYHSAVGITFGNHKKIFPGQKLNFSDKGVEIVSDIDIKNTLQKRNYVGVSFLHCSRISPSFTLLAGPSVQYNYYGKVKERHINPVDNISFRNTSRINKFSFPVSIQLSWSRLQFASMGVFFSRDLAPVYKGDNHESVKQTHIGASMAIIL